MHTPPEFLFLVSGLFSHIITSLVDVCCSNNSHHRFVTERFMIMTHEHNVRVCKSEEDRY